MSDLINEIPAAGENAQPVEVRLATVTEVTNDGLKLQFDGSSEASSKVYKCNSACIFSVGDRVKVTKHSGTYIVDYVIGAPGSSGGETADLVNGDKTVHLNSNGYLVPSATIWLGTSTSPWGRIYANGDVHIGRNASTELTFGSASSTIGFFGHAAVQQPTVANNATVATLITALKSLGLIK